MGCVVGCWLLGWFFGLNVGVCFYFVGLLICFFGGGVWFVCLGFGLRAAFDFVCCVSDLL